MGWGKGRVAGWGRRAATRYSHGKGNLWAGFGKLGRRTERNAGGVERGLTMGNI